MEWIATAALVAIAMGIMSVAWDAARVTGAVLKYMNTPRTYLNTHVIPQELIDLICRTKHVVVTLSSDDRKLLENYRRYAPRAKKETV